MASRKNKKLLESPIFAKRYMIFALVLLFLTTLVWALKGSFLQASNADQLVGPYLFESWPTFHGAEFPGAHTFFIKWPLFLLISLLGSSPVVFSVFTALVVLATVAALVGILYRIEQRPLAIGTICLALASTLLLVPAQPYAGGLLPVNMAMLATRNLEYIVYIAVLVIFVRWPRLKSWQFWAGVGLMGLLVISDKLFLSLSVGGALLALIAYTLTKSWRLINLSVHWLVGSIAAGVVATLGLWLLQASRLTHIVDKAGPYGLVSSLNDFLLGSVYAIAGLFTNFGANPAFDTTLVRELPRDALQNLQTIGGVAFIVNAAVLVVGIYMAWHLVRPALMHERDKYSSLDVPSELANMLIWSSLAAILLFVSSNHYYAVDARYLSIAVFAIFISAAVFSRKQSWQPKTLVWAGGIILVSIVAGLLASADIYQTQKSALDPIDQRNSLVAEALSHHKVNTLVGDYWRVIPTKFEAGGNMGVTPLADCASLRKALSSQAWQPNLRDHSFAYLLTLDNDLTDYPACSLQQVLDSYGRPNSSVLISGSLSHPKELLLFYDKGINKSASVKPNTSAVTPISINEMPNTTCEGPTVMNLVAHEDDDLLFMNPDLQNDIKGGRCIRTVYLTAGDAGSGRFYWLNREQGSEAAYSQMLGSDAAWVQHIVKLSDKAYMTVNSPVDNPKVSLVFLHLPDGNVKGDGFSSSHHESLARLEAGDITDIHAVDGQSTYSSDDLVSAVAKLMHAYRPTTVRSQASYVSGAYPDHSDHMAVGRYVQKGYEQYEAKQFEGLVTIPIHFYIGYPVNARAANVSGDDLAKKEDAFGAYARFDGGVCHSRQQCQRMSYGAYLQRQYKASGLFGP